MSGKAGSLPVSEHHCVVNPDFTGQSCRTLCFPNQLQDRNRNFLLGCARWSNMTTEGRGAADRNCPQRLLLLIRERISKGRQVSRAVEAENVAQLQCRRCHRTGSRLLASGSRSKGLTVVRTARLETCRYLAVVLRLRCPSST